MKSTLDTLEGLARKLNIEVPLEKVTDAFDSIYKDIQKRAEIKGFRKGKAPLATIKSLYSSQVKQDALQQLVSKYYQEALHAHSLEPISHPQINIVAFDEEAPLSFTAELEVRPEIKLKKISGLKVEKEKFVTNEAEIDQILERIRQDMGELVTVFEDRGAREGDFASIDFDGYVDGQPLEGGKAEGHTLELGSNSFIEGFEEGLIGMKPNETRELNLKFPDEYHAAHLQGKPVHFKVKLVALKKKNLPELSDELAKKVGEQFKTLEDLKKALREDQEKNERKRIDEELKNEVVKALAASNPIDVPKSLVEEQRQRLLADVEKRLRGQGMNDQQIAEYQTKWSGDLEQTALFMVHSSFLIDTIASENDLRPTAEDVNARLEKMAAEFRIGVDKLKEYYKDPSRMSSIHFQVMEEKVIDFLLKSADIKEVDKKKS